MLRLLPETVHQTLTQSDFASVEFKYPQDDFNQVPGLPIYIGRGADPLGLPSWVYGSPDSQYKNRNVISSVRFIQRLKSLHVTHVIALGQSGYDFGDYFGARDSTGLHLGFWNHISRTPLSWFSASCEGNHYRFASKLAESNPNLHHVQVHQDDKLYYEAYVFHRSMLDGDSIGLQRTKDDGAQIAFDTTKDALEGKAVVYEHCKGGIGRSGSLLCAQLIASQALGYKVGELKLPEQKEEGYFPTFLSTLHQNVRTGLLGISRGSDGTLSVNIYQANDVLELAECFTQLNQSPEKRHSMSDRVQLTEKDIQLISDQVKKAEIEKQEKERKIRVAEEKAAAEMAAKKAAKEKADRERIAAEEKAQRELEDKQTRDHLTRQLKTEITSRFNTYNVANKGFFKFHRHVDRAKEQQQEINAASSVGEIKEILQRQKDILDGKSVTTETITASTKLKLPSSKEDLSKYYRFSLSANLKNRPKNPASDSYYQTVTGALADIEKNADTYSKCGMT